jgi:pimeloyl-ACP methyl ester carboxylesterase
MPIANNESAEDSPQLCSEQWIQVQGLQVRFWHSGAGPVLVLVHGLLGYSFSWRHVIPILARNAEVFAPDMPGAGFSECTLGLDGRLASAARRLLGFLDAAEIANCDLVGSSYGGATAMMLARLAPGRVRRLVLVSPANPWSRFGRIRLALLQIPASAALFPSLARPMRAGHDFFLRRLYGDPSRITRDVFDAYSGPMRRKGILEHAVKIVRTWNADMQELKQILPTISLVPTLLVWGSKDRAVDPASAEPLSRNFRTVRIASIERAGHLPYEEFPEEFARIVGEFLATAPPGIPTLHGK